MAARTVSLSARTEHLPAWFDREPSSKRRRPGTTSATRRFPPALIYAYYSADARFVSRTLPQRPQMVGCSAHDPTEVS